jgi:hypothetical protein
MRTPSPDTAAEPVRPLTGPLEHAPQERNPTVKKALIVLACVWCLPLFITTASAQQKDMKGCKDHELFTRMPDTWIHHCSEKTFDAYAFPTGQTAKESVEGRLWAITYYPQATATSKASSLQMPRRARQAVAGARRRSSGLPGARSSAPPRTPSLSPGRPGSM